MLLQQVMAQMASTQAEALMVEDVFQSTLFTGTGSARSITTGIDLSGTNAGLIWLKSRSAATDHALYDTVRGPTYDLVSNSTAAQTTQTTGLTSFNADGFSVGALAKLNTNAATYAAWTFKKQAKFFDVVTWTGDGTASRQIPHSLGVAPGMIVVKRYNSEIEFYVAHRSLGFGGTNCLVLNGTAETGLYGCPLMSVSDSSITLTTGTNANGSGYAYIAYLWAHDDSADGVVQCGSFATDASSNATVELGWEPQYLLIKMSSGTSNWVAFDNIRPFVTGAPSSALYPNLTAIESGTFAEPQSSGFALTSGAFSSGTYIYLAIRRGPMRVPSDGTKVYNAIARTGTGAAATVTGVGFAPDMVMSKGRLATGYPTVVADRLRGVKKTNTPILSFSSQSEEDTSSSSGITELNMDGFTIGGGDGNWNTIASSQIYINWFFRRAPGFFDIVCYTGTGVARTVAHNLGSAPGMIWVKSRSNIGHWWVYHKTLGALYGTILNSTSIPYDTNGIFNSTSPSSSMFSVGDDGGVNQNAYTYVAYLFGDTPELCKAFSYTGNGSNQDIALGFAPRFIIIRRTSAEGGWFVVDSTRGIVSGNDPSLLLNSTAAEVTSIDFIDPLATGFNITQDSTNLLNSPGSTYIGWASA